MNKKVIGFLAGIAVAVVIMLLPLSGIEPDVYKRQGYTDAMLESAAKGRDRGTGRKDSDARYGSGRSA